MKPHFFLAASLVVFLGLSACTQKDEVQTLQNRLDEQDRRIQMLDSQANQTSSQITDVRPAQANLAEEVKNLRVQAASMEGRIADLERQTQGGAANKSGLDSLRNRVGEVERKLQQAANQLALDFGPEQTSEPSSDDNTPVADDTPSQQPASQDPAQALYDQALAEFNKRNYENAQSIWAEFAKTFKKHPLEPNAHFWQGESFYQLGDYARAILSYQEVITNHKENPKYKTALLKQGISFYKMDKKSAGKLVLNNVIQQFPDSAEAKRAKEFLRSNS